MIFQAKTISWQKLTLTKKAILYVNNNSHGIPSHATFVIGK